jgi:hypothetical protein
MSTTELQQGPYAETAFRADAIPRQAPPPEKSVGGNWAVTSILPACLGDT